MMSDENKLFLVRHFRDILLKLIVHGSKNLKRFWKYGLIELPLVLVCDCQQQLLAAERKRFSSNWDDWQQTFTEAKYFSCQLRGRKSRLPVIPIHWFYVPAHHGDWAETTAHRQSHQSVWIGWFLAKSDINKWIFSQSVQSMHIFLSIPDISQDTK